MSDLRNTECIFHDSIGETFTCHIHKGCKASGLAPFVYVACECLSDESWKMHSVFLKSDIY